MCKCICGHVPKFGFKQSLISSSRFTIFGDTSSKSMLGYGGIVAARGLAHVLDALLTARSRLRESWAWRDGEFQTQGCTNCDIVWHAAVSELIRKAKGFQGLRHVDSQHFSPRHPEILSISLEWSIRFLEKRILHALWQVVISKKNDRKDHIAYSKKTQMNTEMKVVELMTILAIQLQKGWRHNPLSDSIWESCYCTDMPTNTK